MSFNSLKLEINYPNPLIKHQPRRNMKSVVYPNSRSGFTIVELLTAISIIAVLAAILIPITSKVRDKSASSQAVSKARQIGLANLLYAQDNNGEYLGQGRWEDTMRLFSGLTRYTSGSDVVNPEHVKATLADFTDPNVPEEFVNYGTYPFTWSINSIFNVRYGRAAEGKAAWAGEGHRSRDPRRQYEFENPSNTIYAVSGGYEFTVTHAENPEFLGSPVARQPIFYLHENGQGTPAVFLDGHTELLVYPIKPEQVNTYAAAN